MEILKAINNICWICGCKVRKNRIDLDGHNYCHKHYTKVSLQDRKEVLKIKKAQNIYFNNLMNELLED